MTLVISHAACAAHAPENTLAGIVQALTLGADAVEVDVRATADRVPVLLHDETVDRTTDGRGPLRSLTLADLRALDAGQGERVPTLAEATALVAGRALLVAEIKEPGIEDLVEACLAPLGPQGAQVWSFLPEVLASYEALARLRPRVLLVGHDAMQGWPRPLHLAERLRAAGLSVRHEALTPKVVTQAHAAGLALYAWTANDPQHMLRLLEMGVDGIVTDYPDHLRALLHGRLAQ